MKMKKFRACVGILLVLVTLFLSSCATAQGEMRTFEPEKTEATEPSRTDETAAETKESAATTEEPVATVPEVTTGEGTEAGSVGEDHVHKFAGATCTEPGKCTCGEVGGEALGHHFTGGTCTTASTCSRCGAKGSALGHNFTGGSCTTPTACSRCGAQGKALGHNFAAATCAAPSTCTRCGLTNGGALGHTYSGGKCTRCGDTNGPLKPGEAALFKNKLSDEENAQALAIARQLASQAKAAGGSDLDKIERAAQLVSNEYRKGVHLESGIYYSQAYGVFVKRESSCAGCCRALGLVLTCMGYQWKHVNEGQWSHQWVTVTVNGETIWADGQVGWAGTGKHPSEA